MRRLLLFLSLVAALGPAAARAGEPAIGLDPADFPKEARREVETVASVLRRFPDEAAVLYQAAALHARAGHREGALAALRKMAAIGAGLDPRSRDFGPLAGDEAFRKIQEEIRRANPPVLDAHPAFTIPEGDLLPEGIAWSATTRRLYLGSSRRIVSYTEDGKEAPFGAAGAGGLGQVLGVRVDDRRGELWAVSNAFSARSPEMVLGLFRFRLADGALIRAYPVPDADRQMLNDVAVASDGSAYATATATGSLYRVDPNGVLGKFLPDGALPEPNGVAATPDGRYLLVAGWYGIWRVDLGSRETILLDKPAGVADGCLDGLYLRGTAIVGVQNCVHETGRVIRFETARDWSAITSARVLESYNPLFDGLATAAVASDRLYFAANAQLWKAGKGLPFDPIRILVLDLPGP